MRGVTFSLAVSLLVPLTNLSTQQLPPLEPGQRLRVTAPTLLPHRTEGMLESINETELTMDAGAAPLVIPVSDVIRIDRHSGHRRYWLHGMVVGGSIGAIIGVAKLQLGACLFCPGCECMSDPIGEAIVGAVPGALVGALVGWIIRTDRWEEVPLDRLRVSVAPKRDGRIVLGVSVSF